MGTRSYVTVAGKGELTFDFIEEVIYVADSVDDLTAQELYEACIDAEDSPAAFVSDGIVDGGGKIFMGLTSLGIKLTAITFVLLRGWKLQTEKVSGTLTVFEGNVVNAVDGTEIFNQLPGVTQVNIPVGDGVTSDSSTLITTMKYMIESLGNHSHQGFGKSFFVYSNTGSDIFNPGTSPEKPFRTIAHALTQCVSGRGDVIYLLSKSTGKALYDEAFEIVIEDLNIRGPGRGVIVKPSTPAGVPTININASAVRLAGFVAECATGDTTDDVIQVNQEFSEIANMWINKGGRHGICYQAGSYHELHKAEIEKHYRSGIATIDMTAGADSPREILVDGAAIYVNGIGGVGYGIELTGDTNLAAGTSTRIFRMADCNVHDNPTAGLLIGDNVGRFFSKGDVVLHGNGGSHDAPQYIVTSTTDDHHLEFIEGPEAIAAAVWNHPFGLGVVGEVL